MPTTPFRPEHVELAASVRRLVDGPLAVAACEAEAGAIPFGPVLRRCDEVGLFDLSELGAAAVLAEVAVAAELGRLRSGGLTRVLLDAMLASALRLNVDGGVAVAPHGEVHADPNGVNGNLPFVPAASSAARCLVLNLGVVVELSGARVTPLVAAHALRGSAPASVAFDGAAFERVAVDPVAVARWELTLAAAAVAGGWLTWSDACSYANQRSAFGRPIARFQVNRHALAAAATKLTAAEALVHDTAHALSLSAVTDTAAALLYAATTVVEVTDRALQLHGGNGYTSAFDVSRAWRDARELRLHRPHLRNRLARGGAP